MPGQFRFLDDVALADSAFEASGESPSELFVAAAHAVIETMVNPQTVRPVERRMIERREETLEALLFEWLSEIVFLKDADAILFRDVQAEVTEAPPETWHLNGTLRGEAIDPARHELRADVKAVTKHLYGIRREGDRWIARVVLDI
jgi:SHS2 domain-containing protein